MDNTEFNHNPNDVYLNELCKAVNKVLLNPTLH